MSYDTQTLIGVVAGLERYQPFLLSMFFPQAVFFDTKKISFDEILPDERIAPFVSPVESGQVMRDRGHTLKEFTPAYVKPKHIVDPQQVLLRQAGEAIGGAQSAASRANAIIANNLMLERDAIRKRQEWMAAQALLTGKVIVSGDKYPTTEVDFGRDANLTKVLAGAALWSDAASKPLTDIDDWTTELAAPITALVFGKDAWRAFASHAEVQKALDTQMRGTQSSLEIGAGNGEWYQLKGFLSGNIACYVYTGYYEHEQTGAPVSYVPADQVILGSPAVRGVRCFGAILDKASGYQALEMFPKNWVDDDPGLEYTMTQSAPLMVPARPNASMAAKVV